MCRYRACRRPRRVCARLCRRHLMRVVRVAGVCAEARGVGFLVQLRLHAAAGHRVRAVRRRGCVEGQLVLLAVPLGALRRRDVRRGVALVAVQIALHRRRSAGGIRPHHLWRVVALLRLHDAAAPVEAGHAAARNGLCALAPVFGVVAVLALAGAGAAHRPAFGGLAVGCHLCGALRRRCGAFLRVCGSALRLRLCALCLALCAHRARLGSFRCGLGARCRAGRCLCRRLCILCRALRVFRLAGRGCRRRLAARRCSLAGLGVRLSSLCCGLGARCRAGRCLCRRLGTSRVCRALCCRCGVCAAGGGVALGAALRRLCFSRRVRGGLGACCRRCGFLRCGVCAALGCGCVCAGGLCCGLRRTLRRLRRRLGVLCRRQRLAHHIALQLAQAQQLLPLCVAFVLPLQLLRGFVIADDDRLAAVALQALQPFLLRPLKAMLHGDAVGGDVIPAPLGSDLRVSVPAHTYTSSWVSAGR